MNNLNIRAFSSMIVLSISDGGMRSWGLRGYEIITRYKTCQRVLNSSNHLNPNFV